MSKNKLAATWIELQSLPDDSQESDEHMWAAEEINLLALRSPAECWEVVLEVLSLTNDKWVLENLGAGPIENMLALNPEVSIALIEKEFPRNSRLQAAVSHVWQNTMPESVWERLQALL